MKLKKLYFLFFITLLCSCESNEVVIDSDNLLIGNWISPNYEGENTTFTRSASLPNEGSGITFKQNGDLIERTSGWCGTPPLTYFNEEGSFTLENDLISIAKESYPAFYGWKILELTENKLVVKREISEQEKDHRVLMDLFSEITQIAYSKKCTDANDWSFTSFGAKACGGPQGYISYPKSIDVTLFLQKIEAYTKAEKEFNIKWSVVSDCSIVKEPKNTACQNGYPTLIY